MSAIVPRTCTELAGDTARANDGPTTTLADYRSLQAYVLLGDPGSGKTTSFRAECDAVGDEAVFISARNFLLHLRAPDEFGGRTLFIDGLDEIRAGGLDGRIPLDQIRQALIQLGTPKFRISCRAADWMGDSDRDALAYITGDANASILRLDPLTEADILEILQESHGVGDPETFVLQAHDAGLEGLLENPQALELLVRAVNRGEGWPSRRREVFELACREMASERNQEHQAAASTNLATDSPMSCAGQLCALLLISDKSGYCLDAHAEGEDFIPRDPCGQGQPECLQAAVSSKLFKTTSEQCFGPVHRQIAEFLGAQHLAQLIDEGLSARRVLALMTGSDGVPVTALAGLSGWLATFSESARSKLISKNPVELGVYGDLDTFSGDDKRRVLEALLANPMSVSRACNHAERFAPLACAATESHVWTVLQSEERAPEQEHRLRFLLRLLSSEQRLPSLPPVILKIVRDKSWSSGVRDAALNALLHYQEGSSGVDDTRKVLLDEFTKGQVSIADSDLCGTLLSELYPKTVGPSQIWDYFPKSGDGSSTGRYIDFPDYPEVTAILRRR